MEKKLISAVLAMAMIAALLPVLSFALDDSMVRHTGVLDGVSYSVENGEAEITAVSPEIAIGVYTIPEKLDECPVTSVGDGAFVANNGLSGIVFPDTLKKIGFGAFEACTALGSVSFPESLEYIGDYAFIDCFELAVSEFPASIEFVGAGAFSNTRWLNEQSDYCVYIGDILYTYKGYQSVVTIAEGTKSIADCAFAGFDSITEIVLVPGLERIGSRAFFNCFSLSTLVIPSTVTYIGEYAFSQTEWYSNKSGAVIINDILYDYIPTGVPLIDYTVPANVKLVANCSFENISELSSVSFLSGVKSIGSGAFSACTKLYSVYVPDTVTDIGENAFSSNTVVLGKKDSAAQLAVENNGGEFIPVEDVTSIELESQSAEKGYIGEIVVCAKVYHSQPDDNDYFTRTVLTGEYTSSNSAVALITAQGRIVLGDATGSASIDFTEPVTGLTASAIITQEERFAAFELGEICEKQGALIMDSADNSLAAVLDANGYVHKVNEDGISTGEIISSDVVTVLCVDGSYIYTRTNHELYKDGEYIASDVKCFDDKYALTNSGKLYDIPTKSLLLDDVRDFSRLEYTDFDGLSAYGVAVLMYNGELFARNDFDENGDAGELELIATGVRILFDEMFYKNDNSVWKFTWSTEDCITYTYSAPVLYSQGVADIIFDEYTGYVLFVMNNGSTHGVLPESGRIVKFFDFPIAAAYNYMYLGADNQLWRIHLNVDRTGTTTADAILLCDSFCEFYNGGYYDADNNYYNNIGRGTDYVYGTSAELGLNINSDFCIMGVPYLTDVRYVEIKENHDGSKTAWLFRTDGSLWICDCTEPAAREYIDVPIKLIELNDEVDIPLLHDVDGNGKIQTDDARMVLRATVGLTELTDEQIELVTGRGYVTTDDARRILRITVGLE